ncbi:MAG: response regulator transcription factor [Erythrobacter sp.]|nr:response regulator transcription factor [Erythrobacter sp.]
MNILIVDDEPSIIRTLDPILRAAGHSICEAQTAKSALSTFALHAIDLVLLDLGLPDADGSELIGSFKGGRASVIVISARHLEADKVLALDSGADDYLDKPFGMAELMARIRVVERRRAQSDTGGARVLCSDNLEIDFARRSVKIMGDDVHLSPKEYALLEVLARSSGQVVTQRRLMIAGWNDPTADTQYLRSYVSMLRDKLEIDASSPQLILTESGVGYRLSEELVPIT